MNNAEAQRRGGAEKAQHLNSISGAIVDAAIEVHRELGGPGLLESVYEEALVLELRLRGLKVERQLSIPIHYKGTLLDTSLSRCNEIIISSKRRERHKGP